MGLLREGVFANSAQVLLPHVPQLMEVIDMALAVSWSFNFQVCF
jgi:hypothetical protein